MRAVIYTRLSEAKATEEASQATHERQEAACRETCQRLGLEVVGVYQDHAQGAYSGTARRSALASALLTLQSGEAEALVVWRLDRLSRQGAGKVASLLDGLETRGAFLVSVADGIDTRQASARLVVTVLAELARAESASTGTRVRAARAQAQGKGLWWNGRPPWGLRAEEGRLSPDPATAEHAREAIRRLSEGEALYSVAGALNEAGLRTATGRAWTASALGAWARSPALAGILPEGKRGSARPALGPSGAPVSVGEGLVSFSAWRALQGALRGRTAFSTGRRAESASWASGLGRCGLCGGPLRLSGRSFVCSRRSLAPGTCQGTTALREALEETLGARVLAILAALEPEEVAEVARAWRGQRDPVLGALQAEAREALAEVEARLADLEEARYLRGEFQGPEALQRWARMRDALQAEARERREALGGEPEPEEDALGALLDPAVSREAWEGASREDRRAVARSVLEGFTLGPSRGRGTRWDPSRVSVTRRG